MGYPPRTAANRVCNQPKRETQITINNAGRSWSSEECFDIRHGDAEFGVFPAGFFGLALVCYFLAMLPSLHFRMVMYILILCHFMLEACDLIFDFTGDYRS